MRESIFVVDDEPCVLGAVCGILRRAGYDVVSAADPAEALRAGAARSTPVHLLLSDVIMPGMSGPTMAERFAELHPEAQVMFMAGMPDNPEVVDRILSRRRAFLPKPFMADALLTKIREVLSSGAGQLVA